MDVSVIDAIRGGADFAFGKAAVSEVNLRSISLVSEYGWPSLVSPEFTCSAQQDFEKRVVVAGICRRRGGSAVPAPRAILDSPTRWPARRSYGVSTPACSQKIDTIPEDSSRTRKQRKRRDRDHASSPVEPSYPERVVRRPPLARRYPGRHRLETQRSSLEIFRPKERGPLACRHLPRFGERASKDLLGRLVVEDEIPVAVGYEHRGRELRSELARKDENELLLPPARLAT
jgi:hypothetical protein